MTSTPPPSSVSSAAFASAAASASAASSASSRRFVYREGALVGETTVPDARRRLEVADSWLVDAGRVRAIGLHRARFLGSAAEAGFGNEALLEAFWDAALGAIPPVHRWFPRVELVRVGAGGGAGAGADAAGGAGAGAGGAGGRRDPGSDGAAARGGGRWELALTMRIAPPLSGTAVLQTHRGADPRGIPGRKGPDLETLTGLRDAARADGVDDVVLLGAGGEVVDGATSAILWWRGSELRMPPADLARVDSVTARSVAAVAAAVGVVVGAERAAPEDLAGTEVWAVNALHGVRVVTSWVDGPAVAAVPGRAALWQRRLAALARPLGGVGG